MTGRVPVPLPRVAALADDDAGGVDDDGTTLGLDADYATLKVPDADRFELWLRDLFTTALGQNSAVAVGVSIEDVATLVAALLDGSAPGARALDPV